MRAVGFDQSVAVEMIRKQIESNPEYDPHHPDFRDYKKTLLDHYRFSYSWI